MDSPTWKIGWLQFAMLDGNACTFRMVAGQDGGHEPSILPDSACPIG
jgi:hypothetical protein